MAPYEGDALIYLHSYCLGREFSFNGPKVYINNIYRGDLLSNGYFEFHVPSGEYQLKVVKGSYEDGLVELNLSPGETVYVNYSYGGLSAKTEIGIVVNALKGKVGWTDLSVYPESYASATMENCMKIEKYNKK